MLCKISLVSDGNIILPFGYQYNIQSMLYNWINEETYSSFLHNVGYSTGSRSYKLFSFSNILQAPLNIDYSKKIFVFPKEVTFYVCSVDNEFFIYIFNSILNKDDIKIGNNKVDISNVELIQQTFKEKEIIKTLSPITVYSTLYSVDGKKKTYYYSPQEKEFSELIRKNLINKYYALNGELPTEDEFSIVAKTNTKEKIIKYKDFVIKGHVGTFEISGSKALMELAFSTGLGSKNSQGFGMILQKE